MKVKGSMAAGLAILALIAPTTAFAKITHLNCVVPAGSSDYHWKVTLNEEASTVDYTILETGIVQRKRAIFTDDEVSFGDDMIALKISRTDLTFTRIAVAGSQSFTSHGRCEVAPDVDRKF